MSLRLIENLARFGARKKTPRKGEKRMIVKAMMSGKDASATAKAQCRLHQEMTWDLFSSYLLEFVRSATWNNWPEEPDKLRHQRYTFPLADFIRFYKALVQWEGKLGPEDNVWFEFYDEISGRAGTFKDISVYIWSNTETDTDRFVLAFQVPAPDDYGCTVHLYIQRKGNKWSICKPDVGDVVKIGGVLRVHISGDLLCDFRHDHDYWWPFQGFWPVLSSEEKFEMLLHRATDYEYYETNNRNALAILSALLEPADSNPLTALLRCEQPYRGHAARLRDELERLKQALVAARVI